jgi:DNA-directed RNA polymerase I subunit RPA43
MKLAGRVTLCSPDHVSLLVHRTFNVSIPRHHIPTDQWEFEYGPAENDPEFGNADDEDAFDADITADAAQGDDDTQVTTTDQRGRWVHKVTGDRLGGKDRRLEFTVVGYAFHSLRL